MALPDYNKLSVGTTKTWKSSGGDYPITLTSLANDAAREGVKGDLGEFRAALWEVFFTSSVASAPTNGKEIELYWYASTSSTSTTDNPGNCQGTDSALSNPDEVKQQLVFIGSIVLSNARGTTVQKQRMLFRPICRYGGPAVVNKSGLALGSTAADHEIRFTPVEEGIHESP